jgi:hypothetical protein
LGLLAFDLATQHHQGFPHRGPKFTFSRGELGPNGSHLRMVFGLSLRGNENLNLVVPLPNVLRDVLDLWI